MNVFKLRLTSVDTSLDTDTRIWCDMNSFSQLSSHGTPQTGLKRPTGYRKENAIAVFAYLGCTVNWIPESVDILCLGGVDDTMPAQIGNTKVRERSNLYFCRTAFAQFVGITRESLFRCAIQVRSIDVARNPPSCGQCAFNGSFLVSDPWKRLVQHASVDRNQGSPLSRVRLSTVTSVPCSL